MIRRVLVADGGDTARRVFATCRALGIETVAAHFPDRTHHAAPVGSAAGTSFGDSTDPVHDADLVVELPAGPGRHLRATALAAARHCAADAIHPGCGPLATDPGFAVAALDAGLSWVGPPPATLKILASKTRTAAVLGDADLPILPIFQDPALVTVFPVVIKPNAGHDGMGIRVVREAARLPEALADARRDTAATGEGTVLCQRYLERARHIEVQVVADSAGTVVPLGERECSVQRRRKSIIDEAPSPAVDPGLRAELFAAAVAACRAVGYVGVASVEFLLAESGAYHLLGIDPRLPSAHAVTECVFGVDLVRLQFLIAEGGALPFTTPPPMRGHAIAARLLAEDPANDWQPGDGLLYRFQVPGAAHGFGPLLVPGVRLDAAVSTGERVDAENAFLGTVVTWAPERREAARSLATTLVHSRLHGVNTNRDLLVRVLRHPAFNAGATDSGFLDRHPDVFAPLLSSLTAVRLSCLATALASAARHRAATSALSALPAGWRNVPSAPQTVAYRGPTGTVEVSYRFDRRGQLATWSAQPVDPDEVGIPDATTYDDLDTTGELRLHFDGQSPLNQSPVNQSPVNQSSGGPSLVGSDSWSPAAGPHRVLAPRSRPSTPTGRHLSTDAPTATGSAAGPSPVPDLTNSVTIASATASRVVLNVGGVRLAFEVSLVPGHPEVWYVDGIEGSVALVELSRYPVASGNPPSRTAQPEGCAGSVPGRALTPRPARQR